MIFAWVACLRAIATAKGARGKRRTRFHSIPHKRHSARRLLSHETDSILEADTTFVDFLKSSGKSFRYSTTRSSLFYALVLNTQKRFKDEKVRRALAGSIDFEALFKAASPEPCIPISGLAGTDSPYHHPDVEPFHYDPSDAAKVLSGFSFNLLVSSTPLDLRIAEFLEASSST